MQPKQAPKQQLSKQAPKKLVNRLLWINSLMILLFSSLFVWLVIEAEDQIEVISLHHWLDAEANLYEQNFFSSETNLTAPNPYKFDLFFSGDTLPNWLSSYQTPGFYEHQLGPEDKHFLVRSLPQQDGLFYLVFKDNADDYLDSYEAQLLQWVLILGIVMFIILVGYAYVTFRQIMRPIQQVLAKIPYIRPDSPDFPVTTQFEEFQAIEYALLNSKQKIRGFFQREQEFSRFSAHEIRTPLMVLRGSAELLNRLKQEDTRALKARRRIIESCDEIALLTDTFLLLGKDQIDPSHYQENDLHTILTQEYQWLKQWFPNIPVSMQPKLNETKVFPNPELHLPNGQTQMICHNILAPSSFIVIVVRNLLKNAASYSQQDIKVSWSACRLCIANPYQQKSEHQPPRGYGYGLIIVERICQRMGWDFQLKQTERCFEACVRFEANSSTNESSNYRVMDC
ncbi:sensor histidine kinase [Thiomicrorhabdus indica]|uniref:sensor histidine kinase n=1 Tax=Thiomicrorhabdus indica TaxID=2267253 RepID=UPI0013EE8104|nr:HAMP domain-containing sensor histidine kinase [Thiomicrorhabdus indica]